MKTTLVTNILLDERLEYCRSGISFSNFLSPYKMDIWECQINFTNGDVWVESCSCRLDFAQMYQVGRNEHYFVFFLLHVLRIIAYKFQIDLKLFFFSLLSESKCPSEQFGPQCKYQCNCEAPCDPDTGLCRGKCRQSASQMWYGPTCQLGKSQLHRLHLSNNLHNIIYRVVELLP